MTGFQSRVRDVINQAAPTYATVATADRGLLQFIDPSMTGQVRFMQKAGYPFSLLTPQMSAALVAEAATGTQTVLIQGSRLLPWLLPDMGVSFELLEDAVIDSVQDQGDGNALLVLKSSLVSSHAAGTSFRIRSFPVYPVDSTDIGAGAVAAPAVVVTSSFLLVPGDVFTIEGSTFTIDLANLVSLISGVYTYEIKVNNTIGFPALSPSSIVTVAAKPAYQSELLTVPQTNYKSLIMGPVAVDWVSGPTVADYRPMPESTLYLEEYNVANSLLVPFRPIGKNDTLARFPIGRDQMLFWNYAEGGTNWDGTYVQLKAFDSGRVHAWTPCRPPLDPAPLTVSVVTVPSFSPYQVNLLNKVLPGSVAVYDAVSKAAVPVGDYTVNDLLGTVSFVAAWASVSVIIYYRPRIEWQIPARADADNIELTVTVGREAKQVFNLGLANTNNILTVEVLTDISIDQLHVTGRRVDDSDGPFTVFLGDWQPRGGVTGAIRYVLTTAAEVDYDFASSGLLFKSLWPTIELLRARLDGASIFARYLDNGRMLV